MHHYLAGPIWEALILLIPLPYHGHNNLFQTPRAGMLGNFGFTLMST